MWKLHQWTLSVLLCTLLHWIRSTATSMHLLKYIPHTANGCWKDLSRKSRTVSTRVHTIINYVMKSIQLNVDALCIVKLSRSNRTRWLLHSRSGVNKHRNHYHREYSYIRTYYSLTMLRDLTSIWISTFCRTAELPSYHCDYNGMVTTYIMLDHGSFVECRVNWAWAS